MHKLEIKMYFRVTTDYCRMRAYESCIICPFNLLEIRMYFNF